MLFAAVHESGIDPSRHSVLKAQINKTDRNGACGMAQMRRASQRGPARFPLQTLT
jgi:hypothetical protein